MEEIFNHGPRRLAELLRETDLRYEGDAKAFYVAWFDGRCFDIIENENMLETHSLLAVDEDVGLTEKDRPYGYSWARATPLNPGNPTLEKADCFLWHWGYAFWDEDRLRSWGFEIGGQFYY